MSSRPGAPGAPDGDQRLRKVLKAGMSPVAPLPSVNHNDSEGYAVTIATAHIYQPGETGDEPFMTPTPTPNAPLVTYTRYPEYGETVSLDMLCRTVASGMLTNLGLYHSLWDMLAEKIKKEGTVPIRSGTYVKAILNTPFSFEALLCMNNALTRSSDKRPYIDWPTIEWGADANDSKNKADVFGLCFELRNLVEGLKHGQWHSCGEKPSMRWHVVRMAEFCDPRSDHGR